MRFMFRRKVLLPILLAGIAFLVACVFFLIRLDYVIHHDLYSYGLQFNEEWVIQYWTYKNLALVLIGTAILTNCFGLLYLFATRLSTTPSPLQQRISKRKSTGFEQRLSLTFLGVGALALAFSISYSSSTLAFVGLGLIFWGALFLYIRTGKYVNEVLLDKTALSSLVALDWMISELGFEGQPVYLPPRYLRDFESSRVFISKEKKTKLPNPDQFLTEGNSFFINNQKGISFEPPGAEITKLLEKVLETSFTKTKLQYFEQNILKTLVEDLEIAQDVEIKSQGKRLNIRLENSTYAPICSETQKLSKINSSIGCPICSALACALTKTTGKPVVIEKEQATEDDRSINIEYRLLDET